MGWNRCRLINGPCQILGDHQPKRGDLATLAATSSWKLGPLARMLPEWPNTVFVVVRPERQEPRHVDIDNRDDKEAHAIACRLHSSELGRSSLETLPPFSPVFVTQNASFFRMLLASTAPWHPRSRPPHQRNRQRCFLLPLLCLMLPVLEHYPYSSRKDLT